MTHHFPEELAQRYHTYVNTFRDASGGLPLLLQLKLDHTHHVVADARSIMSSEGWDAPACRMGEVCALLHDTARYSQCRDFGTFRDRDSFDHADAAVGIIEEQGWLAALAEEERRFILTAVRVHNKRDVPAALAGLEADLAHLVRDADKLDIFRVLEEAVNDGSLFENPEIAWALPAKGTPNAEVVEAVSRGESVSYDTIHTLADFVLIQVGWLNGGLHFKAAARIALERKTLEFREALLKTFTDEHSGIERCCGAARAFLESRR